MRRKTPTNRPDEHATSPSYPTAQHTPIKPVQRRLLVPLAMVLLLLVGGFESLLLNKHHDDLDQASHLLLQGVSNQLEESLTAQSENLEAIENVILNDKDLTASLAAQNRKALQSRYNPLYAQLRAKHHITHFYFHRPDCVNLIRLHDPSRSGGVIERFTLHEAKRTRNVASGIELGPMGTFTLRVVSPVFDNGTLIGYLELGKEIEDVLEDARASCEIDLAVTIHKTNIHREAWQAGMKMMGREGNWNRFAEDVVIYSTARRFPKAAERLVGKKGSPKDTMADVEIDGKPFHALTTPLNDASGIEVGDLLIFKDMSEETAQFNRMILVSSVVATILASILVVFLYFALRRIDRGIMMQRELENRHQKIKVLNESLEMACQIADAATRAKSCFLANMSHEIRTPMTSIIGFAENMLDTDQTDVDKFNCAKTIHRNGEQLLNLINDILDLSKIETGKMEVERLDCDPCRIIADVATLMRARAEKNG